MKQIRCPIHNYISLDEDALRIVDLPVFQRLRGIKQLGMAYLVYPGAQHSRFEHSLGVYHLGLAVSSILDLPDHEARMIALSGLLHDIGHGPFSHIMETVSDGNHEEKGARIIRHGEIADLLKGMGIDPAEISDTIVGRSRYSPMISSEIDIDRMDYLLRDAHYTGVSTALDSGRLSAVMELEEGDIIFREAGLGAVEALLLARFMMYPYVYYHHTARSAERMMVRAIELLIVEEGCDKEALWSMDDIDLVSMLRKAGGFPASIMKAIDERRLFKRGWMLSLSQLLEAVGTGLPSEEALELLKVQLTREKITGIEQEIASLLDVQPESVILDCPIPPGLNTGKITIRRKDGELVPARSLSRIISIMEKAQLDHWRFRVFVPEEFRDLAHEKLAMSMQEYFQV